MSNDNSVISTICRSFPSPDWDHKRHIISKTQKAHDKAFIEAMCASFVFASTAPSIERKSAPKDESKLAAYDAFTPIMASRCEQAAKCIHSLCVEFGKRLTYLRCIEDNVDHVNLTFELKSYKHYVRVFSELKAKCGAIGGVVLSWPALQAGTKARMFLPHYLLIKEFVHTVPQLSRRASEVLGYVEDDNLNVIYNDCPAEIPRIRQVVEYAASEGEPLLSDGNRKQKKSS